MDEISNHFGSAEQLWRYIKDYSVKAGCETTRIVLELYYVLKSPYTPALDKTLIIAALGYQLLPDDKKLLSREKHGLIGLLDNGAALALAYNRVKARVTPQIQAQVDAILIQWFESKHNQLPIGNKNSEVTNLEPQEGMKPVVLESPIMTNRASTSGGSFIEDEDVVID